VPQREALGIASRLLTALDPAGPSSLSSQMVQGIWQEVVEGTLETGARLPTVRHLAVELGMSPRVVERAYEQLEKLGVITTRTGEGSFVSLAPPPAGIRDRYLGLEQRCRDLFDPAAALGFTIDEAVDVLLELRATRPDDRTEGATE
jgi:DNA-binding transcriptional regulator YhcF (GntR family)